MKKYRSSLMIFRRDLRVEDNTALHTSLRESDRVFPCFIFDDRQIQPHAYFSLNGAAFLVEALEQLCESFSKLGARLHIFHGQPARVLEELIRKTDAQAVYVNKDYTKFSCDRDKVLQRSCDNLGVEFRSCCDLLLLDPEKFSKPDGTPYTVFTPFYKRAVTYEIEKPSVLPSRVSFGQLDDMQTVEPRKFWPSESAQRRISFGVRHEALEILERAARFKNYKQERDEIAKGATTHLSAHNKFGTVSIREVYWSLVGPLGKGHDLVRQLYWRDFFSHIACHFPRVFGGAFHSVYDNLQWSGSDEDFETWCRGQTGFPIVDAGMRELVATGFMHNRVRMIAASFLVKDLHIDWRRGEQFFARHLTEYDPAVNNGSWQWSASTGCDAQPYFRIFNPWLQQQKFDPECEYIKRWIPELKSLSAKEIHALGDERTGNLLAASYPAAIVDHAAQKIIAEEAFRKVRGGSDRG